MTIRARTAAIISIVAILGGILVLDVTGLWITEGTKVPTKIASGEFAGLADPASIKGSFSLEDIEKNFSVPAETLASAYALDTVSVEASSYQAKSIEERFEGLEGLTGDIGTDSVRFFVALYLGIPYEPEENTMLPSTATDILLAEGNISVEEFEALSGRVFAMGSIAPAMVVTSNNENPAASSTTTFIKGNTTFGNLLEWGLTETEIEEVLGMPMATKTTVLKDFLAEKGIEFSTYKSELQALLDAKGN
jgi:hypothetical protein